MYVPFPTVRHPTSARPVMGSREKFLEEMGHALRRARRARGWTLRDVGRSSGGEFKSTAVASYERGERAISLERFCGLAEFYGMRPDRILSQILWRLRGGPEPTIDRRRLPDLPDAEAGAVTNFIDEVRQLRGDSEEETIAIRIQDLEVLATVSGQQLDTFLKHLRPALATASRSK
jgi:transcriptional regulator with XRE-family HTH domain